MNRWRALGLRRPEALIAFDPEASVSDLLIYALTAPGADDPIEGILRNVSDDLGYIIDMVTDAPEESVLRSAIRRMQIVIALFRIAEGRPRGRMMPFEPPDSGAVASPEEEDEDTSSEPRDPPVTKSFLGALGRCTWRDDRLVDRGGKSRYLTIVGGEWDLGASGYWLKEDTYRTLLGARANQDGSFTDTTGVKRWLSGRYVTT